MIKIPKEKVPARRVNPKTMIIFGKPKNGKTTVLTMLDDCLIIDLERGTETYDALAVQVNNIVDLFEVLRQIEEAERPYRFIALDTITKLEDEIIMPYAIKLYKNTPMGANYTGDDLRKLPNGAGYLYIREAMKDVVNRFSQVCDTLILVGHCNEKQIEKEGKEMYEMELDLSGKFKRILSANVDTIGFLYRKDNVTYLNFNGGGDAIIESRIPHLANKEFVLMEKHPDKGEFVHNWSEIFK